MAWTVTLNGNTYTDDSFAGYNYSDTVTGFPGALSDFMYHSRDILRASSSTTINLSTVSETDTVAITVEVYKFFEVGQTIKLHSSATPADSLAGIISLYDYVTGDLEFVVSKVDGTASYSNWVVALGFSVIQESMAIEVGYAQEWAIQPEDVPVTIAAGGDGVTTFSSLHWAAKGGGGGGGGGTSDINYATLAKFGAVKW